MHPLEYNNELTEEQRNLIDHLRVLYINLYNEIVSRITDDKYRDNALKELESSNFWVNKSISHKGN